MSRQFLVINHSSTLRKIVRTQIRANLNDAVVLEAEQADEALRMIRDRQCHMALFLWDQALPQDPELLQKLAELPEDQRVPTLVMTTDVRGETLDRFRQAGINEHLPFPCLSETLAETLNRICNPVSLRRDKRYAFSHANFLLEQRGHAFEGTLVNASLGGLLGEMPYSDNFNWSLPATASINLAVDGDSYIAPHLYCAVVQVSVIRRYPDFSPKMLRISFNFLQIPETSRQTLEQAFERAEAAQDPGTPPYVGKIAAN
ncbi:MAG: hypothetical protein SV239_00940 [Thermodesulfobacteriota bacterium]|jgi:CheY-like chemotaxis protein|nr:hypothetical protein [Thermodesulfobacteriota bacterium]